ncbi:MAG: hypothetical protein CMQ75_01825 [Gammaproteobacteria bacterium]|nr:hypothetical protein [Gammaproteobacteria bacterium]RPG99532.1 MAG: hypothetical protein CBC78_002025 [Candidatus Pelagibacter sp. TMED118]
MSERKPSPDKVFNTTRPGESLQKIGSRRVTELLPDILQTTVNKQFFDSTFEQLMSSGSLEPIKHYVGENIGTEKFTPSVTDNYLLDNRTNDPYQFSPSLINKNDDNSIDQVLAYDDLLRSLKYNEVNTNNHNKVLNEKGYTLDLPINHDMYINHHRYYWVLDVLPPNELKYTSAFDVDTIIGLPDYTTPTMQNGKTLTFENGMRIKFSPHTVDRFTQTNSANTTFTASVVNATRAWVFVNNIRQIANTDFTYNFTTGVVTLTNPPAVNSEIEIHTHYTYTTSGDYLNDAIFIVDGVGETGGIRLTKQFEGGQYQGQQGKRTWLNVTVYNNQEPAGFDTDQFAFDFKPFDLREHRMTTRDYTCEQRHAPDQSAWSRSNLWVHEETIAKSLIYQGITDDIYTLDRYRAVRPIIEYKKGLEKYRHGLNQVCNVDHFLESTDDPATTIIGQTSYNVLISGITQEWSGTFGYDRGQKVKVTSGTSPNFVITYWECVEAHGETLNPTHGENRRYWEQIVPVEVEDNDLMIFFNSSNTLYNNKIWRIGGVGTSITLTVAFNFDGSSGATQVNTNDKILILNGFNTFDSGTLGGFGQGEREAPVAGCELFWNGTKWAYQKQKEHRSQGMPVVLYDTDLTSLDDGTKYSDSDFFGTTLFDFVHNTNNDYDDALGFNPEYVDYGNNPGLNFCCKFLSQRFTFVNQSADNSRSNQEEIKGYYYYKYFTTGRYHNGWSELRDTQRVHKKIRRVVSDSGTPMQVDVGHSSFVGDRYYNIFKEDQSLAVSSQPTADVNVGRVSRIGGKLPTLFFHNSNNYTINTVFPQAEIEFVNMNDSPLGTTGVIRTAGSQNQFQIQVGTPTVSGIKYRLVSDPANFGVIFFSANPNETNVTVLRNGKPFSTYSHTGNIISITSGLIIDDIYEFSFYTDAEYTDTGEGVFDIAQTQTMNPQNTDFGTISFGDLIQHLSSQMTNNPLLTGNWYGTNNYRNIVHVNNVGGTIRQQPYSTELLNQLLVDVATNPYSSLQFASANYEQFKERFKLKIVQLHESLDQTLPVYHLVDKTLEALNLGKNTSSVFAKSQMAMYRDYKSIDVSWVLNQTPVFDLPEEINNYDDTFNHVQVWIQIPDANGYHTWKALTKDRDYNISANKVTITANGINSMPSSGKNNAHIRWYKRESVSFVPPSAVKLGLVKPSTPEVRSDYNKDSNEFFTTEHIVGHDGSIHIRNGTELHQRQTVGFNPVDAGLWDLENRIYNNLGTQLDETINQSTYMPNAHRPAVYTLSEVNETVRSEFNKWKANNNITELNSTTYYDGSDKFTWNYSSVGPGIGGWRGLYQYYFNTDRPHSHPWEMLGFNKKPTWWDANYSWTDATKRSALLLALEFGKVSDPSLADVYDINYALKNYNWQVDTLVTLTGILNDPDTANVVATPNSADAAKDFVYGDWGPVEEQWRRTSSGKIANIIAFLRTRPLVSTNNYFRTARRKIKNISGYNSPQDIDTQALKLSSWKDINISGSSILGKIIESVNIIDPGSGYTSSPTVQVSDNFGLDGAITVFVENGSIVGASVSNQGYQYFNRPLLELSSGSAVIDPILAENATHYYNGLSNAVTEFSKLYGTNSDVLEKRLENISFQGVIKAGGFVNRNNKFILESSQDKGRVFIPEENVSTVMYTSKPDTEFFFGAITVSKTANGYLINGFDNSLSYFNYNKPNTATDGVQVKFEGQTTSTVLRYKVYEPTISKLDYKTELRTIQEVYDFINGYGHYLNSLGFTQQWRTAAANFVTWAVGSSTIDISLIPDQTKVIVDDKINGYFDNIDKKYDGVYNIVNKQGKQIASNELLIDRVSMDPEAETIFQVKDTTATEIFGLRLYKVQLEHVFVFDTITNFDDVIHDLSIGLSHKRIIWRGSRTRDWNGKLYTPGYIVTDNTVIPNYDTTVKEVDQYLGRTNTLSNKQLSDVARFNAGYNKPKWSEKLDIDDDTLYEFVKGSYKYQGTNRTLSAFMRNQGLYDGEASAELLEKWAVRIADFGDTSPRRTLEFQITPQLLVTSPQPVRISSGFKHDVLSDIVIDVDQTSPLKVHDSTEDNFLTRPVNTFKDSSDELFAGDFTTSGLPLLSESDYRVLNKEDFTQFPTEVKSAYDHSGNWQDIGQWDSKISYKFNEKVLYNGRTWSMIDEDGSSGVATANDPIAITGTTVLPVIPSSGQTLVIDGNTVSLQKSATSTTTNVITVTGTEDIRTTNVVPHGSTVILGQSSALNTTVTFANSVTTTTFNDVEIIGTVTNPTIQGSNGATLIIDGTTVTFADTIPTSTNISAQTAYENAFNASWVQNTGQIATTASTRISRIEGLRSAYVAANSTADWTTWITTYYTNNAGLNIDHLKTLIALGGSTETPAQLLLDQDCIAINNIRQTSYNGTNVGDGTETIAPTDITNSQNALNGGAYTSDIATFLKNSANAGNAFLSTTVVAQQTGTTFKNYTLAEIIQEITDAGISNITASADASRLKITKTTNTPSNPFTLTIGVGTRNNSVGFGTAVQQKTSSSQSVTNDLPLSQQQVIDQINAAGITGVTAQAGATNNSLLQINSTNSNLFIGGGTSNTTTGLPSGLIPASTTQSTSNVGLNIIDIVEKINTLSIAGVTASNASNKLRLTSTNSTLVIGAGTGNTTVGLTAQTISATQSTTSAVFNALVDNNGNPVFQEDANDPNIFSIWVADDSEFGNYNLGYQIYQTMDFGMYTFDICAGPEAADEAEIKVNRQTGDVQAHNLAVGDFILIRGSNSVPNIDGVHKVTKISNQVNKFFIDAFIEQNGNTGNVYPLRKMRFSTYTALEADRQVKVNNVFKYNFADIRQTLSANPIYAFVDDDGTGASAVYRWIGTWNDTNGHVGNWDKVRSGTAQARNDLLENITLYDAEQQSTITTLETYDPAKGIIFGFVDREIDFKTTNDIANYNFNNIDGGVTNIETWGREYLGLRWWNTSTAVYLDYEQSTIDYQQNNWGKLFDGASIDIYEWTASPVLPEQWSELVIQKQIVDGRVASGEAYSVLINGQTVYNWSQENYYNTSSKQTETVYYFWVKNKTNSTRQSNYNVFQLAQVLTNPNSFDLSWSAQVGGDSLLLANITNFVNDDTVAQLKQKATGLALPMQDWIMLAEKDNNITIPEYLHVKVRDSLAGFNRFSVDKDYTTWSNATVYAIDSVVKEGANFYISLKDNNQNEQPSTDNDMSNWSRIYDYDFIEDTQKDDIRIWRGQPVPDLKLHKFNRYGHQVRPRQSLYRDVKEARQNFVHSVNSLLSEVNVIDEINNWENAFSTTFVEGSVTYKVKDYVNLVDWHLVEKDSDGNVTYRFNPNTVADLVYDNKNDYINAGEPTESGTYVLIKSTSPSADLDRAEMYYYIDGIDKLVYKEKATIQLSEELWNQSKFGNGYDAIGFDVTPFDKCSDNVIGQLMDLIRSEVFIAKHHVKYNQLWFKLLYTAILQNTASDFAFKTTFAHLGVKRPLLLNKAKYQEYDINTIEQFVNDIKPFHTKILSSMESNTYGESTMINVEEQSRNSEITIKYEDHSTRTWAGDTELLGGTFIDTPTHTDSSLFTHVQADLEYDYNGQVFVQPATEGWGGELVPTDFTENINMLVQTNESGPVTITSGALYSVNSEENQPRGITFNDNGTKMFIIGTNGDDVNEYTLSVGFDLASTVTFVDSYAVTECPNPTAVKFSFNGSKMFVTGVGNSNVHEYFLTTGFDVSTASFTQTLVTSTVDNDNFGLDFKPDGTKMWITGNQNDKIYEYNLSTGFDISTATFNQDLYLGAIDIEPFGIEWSTDGQRLFIVGTRGNGVDEFRVTTPWDISTATHVGFYAVVVNPSGLHFSPDGLTMFVVGNISDVVKTRHLSHPYRLISNDGYSPTANSRAFRMMQYQPMDIQISNVIIDSQKTELLADITVFSDEITVNDVTVFDDPNVAIASVPGVAWIGTERIEYEAIDIGNSKLFGVTRGTLGTSPQAHSTGDQIWNTGPSTRIPTTEKFSHYGNGLRLAYNDSGVSLASAGTTPEHAFIRDAGKGTI